MLSHVSSDAKMLKTLKTEIRIKQGCSLKIFCFHDADNKMDDARK